MLEIQDLTLGYHPDLPVLRGFELSVAEGEVVSLVGESGSGKSSLARALIGLRDGSSRSGQLTWMGRSYDMSRPAELSGLRGRQIAWVPQDVDQALNPVHRVCDQVRAAIEARGRETGPPPSSVFELLSAAGLHDPERQGQQFPHELSGGERQRVLIAIALATGARLIVADEPTAALDLPLRSVVLEGLLQWVRAHQTGLLLLTHDLNTVRAAQGRMAVLSEGAVVEEGSVELLMDRPSHGVTQALISRQISAARCPPKPRDGYLDVRKLTLMSPPGPWLVGKPERALVSAASFVGTRGETLGIIGASGSGKTSLALAILRLAAGLQTGEVHLAGLDLMALPASAIRRQRRRFQWVPQDPASSLSPSQPVRSALEEGLRLYEPALTPAQRLTRCEDALASLGLGTDLLERLPSELSGGQRQRVSLARALMVKPELLVLDEPTSALDWSTQADIVERLFEQQQEMGLTLIWISHDLPLIRAVSHRVVVMRQGSVVESGATEHVFGQPRHSYTQLLLDAAFPLERSTSFKHSSQGTP